MDKKVKDYIAIIAIVQAHFAGLRVRMYDDLIYVSRGSVLLHIIDYNTLEYYHQTGQLEQHLKEIGK